MDRPSWKLEVKQSRTEQYIPVVDGVHLHSSYNPHKEAEAFVAQHTKQIESNRNILVFGLGFGYHLKDLQIRMSRVHGQNYQIWVIEPNISTFQKALELELIQLSDTLRVSTSHDVANFYRDKELVHFLTSKPAIISHAPSFNLYQSFFKNFMSYKASVFCMDIANITQFQGLKEDLKSKSDECTISEFLEEKNRSESKTPNDFLLQAFSAIADTSVNEGNTHE